MLIGIKFKKVVNNNSKISILTYLLQHLVVFWVHKSEKLPSSTVNISIVYNKKFVNKFFDAYRNKILKSCK